jgi:hypothetical protein
MIMSGGGNLTKLSNTLQFTGYLPEAEQTDGMNQVGAWFQQDVKIAIGPFKTNLVEALPAAVRVRLSGNPSLTVLAPGQYFVQLSLGAVQQCTITPSTTDAFGNSTSPTAPLTAPGYSFVSRNTRIATISPAGVITPVRRGECEVLVRCGRFVNTAADGSQPNTTEGCDASVQVRIVP